MRALIGATFAFLLSVFAVTVALTPLPDPINSVVIVELENGHGSGVHLGNGLILTAAHVVKGETKVKVREAGGSPAVEADVVQVDEDLDFAFIKIGAMQGRARIVCDFQPSVGQYVRAIGNPFDLMFVSTWGRISTRTHAIPDSHWPEAFVTNIVTGPGMSGGPVFDSHGRVIGITVGGMSRMLGYSFTVPSSAICRNGGYQLKVNNII